jgi:gas vesicle protein
MKVFLLFCLLALVTCGSWNKNSKEPTCVDKNPFLKKMQPADPDRKIVFDQPHFTGFTKCKGEWSKHGTCCDENFLLEFVYNEQAKIQASKLQLEHTISQLIMASHKTMDWLKVRWMHYMEAHQLAERFYHFSRRPYIIKFSESSSLCWDYMNRLRGSAMCSICSGRSQNFFLKDKILISPQTCKKSVEKCDDFFLCLRLITDELTILKNDLKPWIRKEDTFKPLIQVADSLKSHSPPKDLIEHFERYNSASKKPVDAEAMGHSAASICSMIVNVRKAPVIKALTVADKLSKAFEWLGKRIAEGALDAVKKTAKFAKETSKKVAKFAKDKAVMIGNNIKNGAKKIGKKVHAKVKKIGKNIKQGFSKAGNHLKASARKIKNHVRNSISSVGRMFRSTRRTHYRWRKPSRSPRRSSPSRPRRQSTPSRRFRFTRSYRSSTRHYNNRHNSRNHSHHNRNYCYNRHWHSRNHRRQSNRRGRRLNLLAPPSTNEAFKSDSLVLFKPSDAMFHSFEGFKGTADTLHNGNLQSMNMSLAFP